MALIVVSGPARSGKSAMAQRLVARRAHAGDEVVVAVFAAADGDAEMAARIERHRQDRPPGLQTLEVPDVRSWRDHVPDGAVLLVECFGTLCAAIMDLLGGASGAADAGRALPAALDEELADHVRWLGLRRGDSVVVTNETGWGVVPAYPSGRVFRDALGRANAALFAIADAAYLVVNGRVVDLTAAPSELTWPAE